MPDWWQGGAMGKVVDQLYEHMTSLHVFGCLMEGGPLLYIVYSLIDHVIKK